MNTARIRFRPEIRQDDFWVEDTGTKNAIFVIRMLTESAIEI